MPDSTRAPAESAPKRLSTPAIAAPEVNPAAGPTMQAGSFDILRLQRTIGNAAVQRLLLIPPPAVSRTRPAIQRDDSDAAAPAADPAAEPAADAGVSIILDGATISTMEGALQFLGMKRLELLGLSGEFTGEGAAPESITLAQEEAAAWASVWSGTDGALDQSTADNLGSWFDEYYIPAYNEAQTAQAAEAEARMKEARTQAEALAKQADVAASQARDLQRALFRQEDSNKARATADYVAGIVDCSLAAKGGIDEIDAGITALKPLRIYDSNGYFAKLPAASSYVSKVAGGLESLNKAYAAFQTADAAITLLGSGGGKTQAQGTLNKIGAVATIASAGGTLLGCAAAFGLYANIYLGPAVSAALGNIAVIQDHRSRSYNREMLQSLEDPNAVDWSLEPGGRAMYDFMLAVMRAGDWGSVPAPVPQDILNYFEKNEDSFNAGVTGNNQNKKGTTGDYSMGDQGSPMPMEGWIDKTPDTQRIKYWVFNNRQNIWAMLYGDLAVPSGG